MIDTPEVDSSQLTEPVYDSSHKMSEELLQKWHVMTRSSGLLPEPKSNLQEDFQNQLDQAMPIYEEVVRHASVDGDSEELYKVFEILSNVEAEGEAERLLFADRLDQEQRLRTAVEHINAFGYINTIDKISTRIKNEDLTGEDKSQLESVYRQLQGDESAAISAELSEIYERIDFSKYEINKDQLTENEVDDIEAELDGEKEDWILDVGAGTGRHSLTLASRGYKNVVAFEYEQKHVDMIRESNPEVYVVQGDWTKLKGILTERGLISYVEEDDGTLTEKQTRKIKGAFSYGRTLCHNRTPEAMLTTFDQVAQVLDTDGKFMFDMPDIDWGVYKQRVENMRNNLKKLGVRSTETARIFDGPNDKDKFNRMVLMPHQVKAIADILGYKVVANKSEKIEGDINNIYYTIQKDPEFDPMKITHDEHKASLAALGLDDEDTNIDTFVESWGMTIGQSILFGETMGVGNPHIVYMNSKGRGPEIIQTRSRNNKIDSQVLESKGMGRSDLEIANAAFRKGRVAYQEFRNDFDNASGDSAKRDIFKKFIA